MRVSFFYRRNRDDGVFDYSFAICMSVIFSDGSGNGVFENDTGAAGACSGSVFRIKRSAYGIFGNGMSDGKDIAADQSGDCLEWSRGRLEKPDDGRMYRMFWGDLSGSYGISGRHDCFVLLQSCESADFAAMDGGKRNCCSTEQAGAAFTHKMKPPAMAGILRTYGIPEKKSCRLGNMCDILIRHFM